MGAGVRTTLGIVHAKKWSFDTTSRQLVERNDPASETFYEPSYFQRIH
jgi:hypothetical protein